MSKCIFIKKCLAFCLALLLCGLPVSIYASNETAQAAALPEQKISDTLYAEFARLEAQGKNMANEKIPVWIWYKDINQTQVDNIVKTRTGLTAENAAVDYAMPSPALLNSLQNEEPGSQAQMQAYLAATAQARALEAQRADTLIMTRREVAREQYNVKSAEIIEEVNLDADDIIFKSQYAPVVIAEMTKSEIAAIAKNNYIEKIEIYEEPVIETADEFSESPFKETLKIPDIRDTMGLYGENVKVGIADDGRVEGTHSEFENSNITYLGNEQTGSHATLMARIICGENGIAPDANCYSTNYGLETIEELLSYGVQLINISIIYTYIYGSYSQYDAWFDHLVSQHSVTIVCAVGNDATTNSYVASPALANNVISVGAYDDNGTPQNYSDDILNATSRYDQGTGVSKPDLVSLRTISYGGTSAATAVTTGIIALMLELKPSLAYQPQAIKAILLASCQRKVQNPAGVAAETMAQGITDRQGAGAVDVWNAICIISQGQYGYGTFSGAEEARYFVQPPYGASNMNVSVAWLRNNTASGSHNSVSNVTAGTQHNINLQVYRGETLAGSSALANSSTEMAYIPLSSTSTQYKLRLYKADTTNTESVRYAYAWSTDNMRYNESASTTPQDEPIDGFFYIRNQNNGQYLTVNESTGQVTSAPFSGGRNQQWIIGKTDSYGYTTIKTRSLTYPGNLSRAASGNNAVIDQDTEYLVYFSMFSSTGAHSITHGMQGIAYVHLQLVDGAFQWATYGAPTNFQWHFERVGYQKGDVNLDGSLTVADATLIQQYALEMVTFNDDQLYLADLDNSGTITILDATLLQKLIMGLL